MSHSDLQRYQGTHMVYRQMCRQTHIHIKSCKPAHEMTAQRDNKGHEGGKHIKAQEGQDALSARTATTTENKGTC